jgi:carbonic anhydrase
MNFLKEVLDHNKEFLQKQKKEGQLPKVSKFPSQEVAILTCMDTRLVGLLEEALGKARGECKIIKNAGAIVAHPFGGVMRSIIIAIYVLKVKEIVVIGHKDCGMTNIKPEKIEEAIIEAGVTPDLLRGIQSTGIDLHRWFGGFDDSHENVKDSTEQIRLHPLIPDNFPVHGLVIDPDTGELELVVDGYDIAHLKTYEEYRKQTHKKHGHSNSMN